MRDRRSSLHYEARLPVPNQPLVQFPLSELSISNGNAAFRAESVGFDLAADFLCSIVISVDLMTFQTRVMLRLVALPITWYRQASFLLHDIM